jgi:hypothetical protein
VIPIRKEKRNTMRIQHMILKTFMASVLAILILSGASARAQAQDVVPLCSPSNIASSYAFTATGNLPASTNNAPFAAVGVINVDVNGNVSGSDTATGLGVVDPRTFTGTITVNSDCTGTINLTFVGAPFDGPAAANLVFDDGRKAFRAIQVAPVGAVITINARRK